MARQIALDRSVLNLGILVFAFLQARSVGYTWITISEDYGPRAPEYHSEAIAFWLAIPILLLCCLRGLSLIGERLQYLAVVVVAAPVLVAEAWLLAFVVGDNAHHLSWMTTPPDATFEADAGLSMAMVCTSGVLVCAVIGMASRLAERFELEPTTATSALFLLSAITAASASMPWITGFRLEQSGASFHRGLAAGAAAMALMAVTVLHARCHIDDHTLKLWSIALAATSLAMSVWVFVDVVGSVDPVHERTIIDFNDWQRLHAADGLYAAIISSALVVILPFGLRTDPLADRRELTSALPTR